MGEPKVDPPAETVTLSLKDAKRILNLLAAYDHVASKAAKWGYGVAAPSACWAAKQRLKDAVDGR